MGRRTVQLWKWAPTYDLEYYPGASVALAAIMGQAPILWSACALLNYGRAIRHAAPDRAVARLLVINRAQQLAAASELFPAMRVSM